ncbi:MAG TPA: glycosyltransferase family 39 protein [Elusimicrobiota bacterium]|nr:glycosyltransferase family 39 protein [Elusimicrobiota bacterium]
MTSPKGFLGFSGPVNAWRNSFHVVVLVGIVVLYAVVNYFWLQKTCFVPHNPDEAFHIYTGVFNRYYPVENIGQLVSEIRKAVREPLYGLMAVVANKYFSKSLFVTRYVNLFWFAIALFAVYRLGTVLYDSRAGLYSAFVMAFYPAMFGFSRIYSPEFGLIGVMTFAVVFLFQSDGFFVTRSAVLFGLMLGMGLMIKNIMALFIVGPLVYAVFRHRSFKYVRVRNIIVSLGIALILIIWRYSNVELLSLYLQSPFGESSGAWHEWRNLRVLTWDAVRYQFSPIFFGLFFWSLSGFLKQGRKDGRAMLLLWIVIPVVFFILIPHRKVPRYVIPYLPAFAVISGIGLALLERRRQRVIVSVFVVLGLVQFFLCSFPGRRDFKESGLFFCGREDWKDPALCVERPCGEKCFRPIAEVIEGTSEKKNPFLVVFPDRRHFTVKWALFRWFNDVQLRLALLERENLFQMEPYVKQADYLLMPAMAWGAIGDDYFDQQISLAKQHFEWPTKKNQKLVDFVNGYSVAYKKRLIDEMGEFQEIGRFELSLEDDTFVLLKRKKETL